MDLHSYFRALIGQDPDRLAEFFDKDAYINWHNTNEHFTVSEFIRANCEYPGSWDGELEREEYIGDLIIAVAHIFSRDMGVSFHSTSFIKTKNGRIQSIDEYFGDDGRAPEWRLEMNIGSKIK